MTVGVKDGGCSSWTGVFHVGFPAQYSLYHLPLNSYMLSLYCGTDHIENPLLSFLGWFIIILRGRFWIINFPSIFSVPQNVLVYESHGWNFLETSESYTELQCFCKPRFDPKNTFVLFWYFKKYPRLISFLKRWPWIQLIILREHCLLKRTNCHYQNMFI